MSYVPRLPRLRKRFASSCSTFSTALLNWSVWNVAAQPGHFWPLVSNHRRGFSNGYNLRLMFYIGVGIADPYWLILSQNCCQRS